MRVRRTASTRAIRVELAVTSCREEELPDLADSVAILGLVDIVGTCEKGRG